MIGLFASRETTMTHVPVMAGEILRLVDAQPGHVLVDLTVGAGGHARAFLEATAPTGRLLGSDRDEAALLLAEAALADLGSRVELVHADSVSRLQELARRDVLVDVVLLDLGVSSMQLDEAQRGFSLRADGPLDMRMDRRQSESAADLVNRLSLDELVGLLQDEGQVPRARRLAEAIVERRRTRPFRSTGDLRELVERVGSRRGGRVHPATQVFQALRIAVNRELTLLSEALPLALERLRPGGHLAVLSFHSGEDRIVKYAFRQFRERGLAELLTPRGVTASPAELRLNRRSRSARLRVIRRLPGTGAGA